MSDIRGIDKTNAEQYNLQRNYSADSRRRLEPEQTTRERDVVQGGRGLRNLPARSWNYGADEERRQGRPQGRLLRLQRVYQKRAKHTRTALYDGLLSAPI